VRNCWDSDTSGKDQRSQAGEECRLITTLAHNFSCALRVVMVVPTHTNSGDGHGNQPVPPLCVRFPDQHKCPTDGPPPNQRGWCWDTTVAEGNRAADTGLFSSERRQLPRSLALPRKRSPKVLYGLSPEIHVATWVRNRCLPIPAGGSHRLRLIHHRPCGVEPEDGRRQAPTTDDAAARRAVRVVRRQDKAVHHRQGARVLVVGFGRARKVVERGDAGGAC
jgi:hypothetical protein